MKHQELSIKRNWRILVQCISGLKIIFIRSLLALTFTLAISVLYSQGLEENSRDKKFISEKLDLLFLNKKYLVTFRILDQNQGFELHASHQEAPNTINTKTVSFQSFEEPLFQASLKKILASIDPDMVIEVNNTKPIDKLNIQDPGYRNLFLKAEYFYKFGSRLNYNEDLAGKFEFEAEAIAYDGQERLYRTREYYDRVNYILTGQGETIKSEEDIDLHLKKSEFKKTAYNSALLEEIEGWGLFLRRSFYYDDKFDLFLAKLDAEIRKNNFSKAKLYLRKIRNRLWSLIQGKRSIDPRPIRSLLDYQENHDSTETEDAYKEIDSSRDASIHIERLEFSIISGTIDEMVVFAREKMKAQRFEFRNFSPIPIKAIDDINFSDIKLYDRRHKNNSFHVLLLNEIMKYQPSLGSSKNYSPKDGTYFFDHSDIQVGMGTSTTEYVRKPDLRYFAKLDIFTDAKGFGEEDPNGLVQTEIHIGMPMNSKIWRNSTSTWFPYLGIDIGFSKIENKKKSLEIQNRTVRLRTQDSTGSSFTTLETQLVNPFDLYRFSNFNLLAKVDVFKWRFNNTNAELNLSLRGGLLGTQVKETLSLQSLNLKDTTSIENEAEALSLFINPGLNLKIKPLNKLDFELNGSIAYIDLFNNDDLNSPIGKDIDDQFPFREIKNNNEIFFEKKNINFWDKINQRSFFRFFGQVSFTSNGADFIYFRAAVSKSLSETKAFYQFQAGYSVDLIKLLSKRK